VGGRVEEGQLEEERRERRLRYDRSFKELAYPLLEGETGLFIIP